MAEPTKHIIVYADDDADDLELVKESFAQYSNNVDVKCFLNGSLALNYLQNISSREQIPCLVILDINMPVIDGKETLVRLREIERLKNVPVVLFTTSSQPIDKIFAAKYNAGFITKPLGVKQMEMITDQFIDNCTEEIRKNIRKQIQK